MHKTPKNIARRPVSVLEKGSLAAALFGSAERVQRGSQPYRVRTAKRDASQARLRSSRAQAATAPARVFMTDWPEPNGSRAAPTTQDGSVAALWWRKPFLLATHWGAPNLRR